MADLGETFIPGEVPEDSRGFEPLPVGDYVCQVIESDVVPTKAGDGEILKLTLEVVEGRYERRRIFENLNYRNPNSTAQSIAQRALADLCHAVGLGPVRDSEDLHFKPFVAHVVIEHDKSGGYGPKNRVKRFKAVVSPPSVKSAAAPAQSTSPAPAGRPWSRQSA